MPRVRMACTTLSQQIYDTPRLLFGVLKTTMTDDVIRQRTFGRDLSPFRCNHKPYKSGRSYRSCGQKGRILAEWLPVTFGRPGRKGLGRCVVVVTRKEKKDFSSDPYSH